MKRHTEPFAALIVGTVFAMAAAAFARELPDAPAGWHSPSCSTVRGGLGSVTYTRNDGKTLAPTGQQLQGTTYTYAIVALDTPDTLLAVNDERVLWSRDAGCTWGALGVVESDWVKLAPAPGGRAYAWGAGRRYLAAVDVVGEAPGISERTVPGAIESVVGLGVDRANGEHIRAGLADGTLWDSTDSGRTWVLIGTPPVAGAYAYRAGFDPRDLDHVLFGMSSRGAFESSDGGSSWVQASGLTAEGGSANVFEIVVSPVSGNLVWCEGIDLGSSGNQEIRHIYLSRDGGETFVPVVTEASGLTLANGTPMWAHPDLAYVLYFSFGTGYHDYGSDLFRVNARTGRLKRTHNSYHRVFDIAFCPADAKVLYLALSRELIE